MGGANKGRGRTANSFVTVLIIVTAAMIVIDLVTTQPRQTQTSNYPVWAGRWEWVDEDGGEGYLVATVVAEAGPVAGKTAPVAAPERAQGEPFAAFLSVAHPVVPSRHEPPVSGPDALAAALSTSPWPSHLWDTVIRIANCESGFRADAVGDGGLAIGLMQVRSDYHGPKMAIYNAWTYDGSLAIAWMIYTEAGYSFRPWSCR